MHKQNKGFTVAEMIGVLFVLTILIGCILPILIRSTSSVMRKAHAAADAASLRNSITNVAAQLAEGENMNAITASMEKPECETDPEASLWLNYSKPFSLDAYFVDNDKFYSIPYLSEIALHGSSALETKEPLTLGFWYEAGAEQ